MGVASNFFGNLFNKEESKSIVNPIARIMTNNDGFPRLNNIYDLSTEIKRRFQDKVVIETKGKYERIQIKDVIFKYMILDSPFDEREKSEDDYMIEKGDFLLEVERTEDGISNVTLFTIGGNSVPFFNYLENVNKTIIIDME